MRLHNGTAFSIGLLGAFLTGGTKMRTRKAFQPWLCKMVSSSLGWPFSW